MTGAVVDEIELYVTGTRTPSESDRLLTTLVFTDIVGSTENGARLGDHRWRDVLEAHTADAPVDRPLSKVEITSTGDGLVARFDGPARAVAFALEVVPQRPDRGLTVRAGVHTGDVGVIESAVTGMAVDLCQRVRSRAGPGEVPVTSTVRDLVAGSGLRFVDRGEHSLKGIPEPWRHYAVAAPLPSVRSHAATSWRILCPDPAPQGRGTTLGGSSLPVRIGHGGASDALSQCPLGGASLSGARGPAGQRATRSALTAAIATLGSGTMIGVGTASDA